MPAQVTADFRRQISFSNPTGLMWSERTSLRITGSTRKLCELTPALLAMIAPGEINDVAGAEAGGKSTSASAEFVTLLTPDGTVNVEMITLTCPGPSDA